MFSGPYKTDCLGQVLKLQTLQTALWESKCSPVTAFEGFCVLAPLLGLKKPSGNCKGRERQKREGKCSQLQSTVQVLILSQTIS